MVDGDGAQREANFRPNTPAVAARRNGGGTPLGKRIRLFLQYSGGFFLWLSVRNRKVTLLGDLAFISAFKKATLLGKKRSFSIRRSRTVLVVRALSGQRK